MWLPEGDINCLLSGANEKLAKERGVKRVALDPCVQGTESPVVELRREAVNAVVRQQQIRDELAAIRTQASEIERQAARALARGDELLGRQILARGSLHSEDARRPRGRAHRVPRAGGPAPHDDGPAENRTWQAMGGPDRS